MPENKKPDLIFTSSAYRPSFVWAAVFVVGMHFLLLAFGRFWDPSPPKPKELTKMIIQTVALNSPAPAFTQSRNLAPSKPPAAESPPVPSKATAESPAKPIEKPVPVKEEKNVPKVDSAMKETLPEKLKEPPPQIEKKPAQPPTQNASKPKPPSPKTSVKEEKKQTVATAPVKKSSTAADQTSSKQKKSSDENLKKQKEKEEAEAKKKKAEAERKKQQEKAEAEKKRQQEKADAEKKRQKEIAAAEEAARKRELALLSKAQENLAKMNESRDKISSVPSLDLDATAIPKELGILQVDALPAEGSGSVNWGAKEASYSGEVASRLKKALRLPDYGAVKIELTLSKDGKVVKVVTIESESSKNKAYVESKVPSLLFPPFGHRFNDAAQNVFVITLQNDS